MEIKINNITITEVLRFTPYHQGPPQILQNNRDNNFRPPKFNEEV